jgi:hypothetical protein
MNSLDWIERLEEATRPQGVTDWVVTIEFKDGTSEEHVVQQTDEKSAELAGLDWLDSKESKKSVFQVRKVTAVDTGKLKRLKKEV